MTATQAPTPGPLSAQQEEAIAFNLCSLHGFDPAFVTTQRDFAFAVIREYERARPSLAPTAPVEASGSERESEAWEWLGQLYPNDAPSDLAYDANEMIDAFLAGSERSDRMAKALERIAGEQQYRSGYCQTDITVEPALSADEAQTVAREALAHNPALRPLALGGQQGCECVYCTEIGAPELCRGYTTSARSEALDEGTRLLKRLCRLEHSGDEGFDHVGHDDSRATLDSLIAAARDLSSSAPALDEGAAGEPVAWQLTKDGEPIRGIWPYPDRKGVNIWIDGECADDARPLYAHPSPTPAADDDRVRIAVEAIQAEINAPLTGPTHGAWDRGRIAGLKEALAALKAEAPK